MDPALQERIEKLAQYVSQSNGAMEETVRERQRTNPNFAFLFGGDGASYYQDRRRKWAYRTDARGLRLAGDYIELPYLAGLMERSAMSGVYQLYSHFL